MLKKFYKLLLCIVALLIIGIPCSNVLAASGLNLYYYGSKKNVNYTGQQVKYLLNDTEINMKKTPGIIIDGVALSSYKDIFVNSNLKVKYDYNKAKGTVTLSKDGTKIVLTIGSKKAYVNGKEHTLSVAPVKVLFKNSNVTKILVPTRFVTENLGYTYVWNSAKSTVNITSPMNLEYNNKEVQYKGTLGKVTIDGKNINLGNMPSIIVNETTLVRAKQVFSSSSIKAKYSYNKKNKEITLTKDDRVVTLTVGSNVAIVNGKERIMDTTPLVVANLDVNTSYVLVPASFVASYLGYDYKWDSSTKTSIITTRDPEKEYEEEDMDGPELGIEPIVDHTDFNWGIQDIYANEYNEFTNMTNLASISMEQGISGYIYYIDKEPSILADREVYSIRSTSPFNLSTITEGNNGLHLRIENTFSDNNAYYHQGSLVDIISTTYNYEDNSTMVTFPLKDTKVKYQLSLSEDKMTLYLTVYYNFLTSVVGGTSGGKDFVRLTGSAPLDVSIMDDTSYLMLQVNNIRNVIGDNTTAISNQNYISGVHSYNVGGNIALIHIDKKNYGIHSVVQEGNTYTVYLSDSAIDTNPSIPEDNNYDATIPLPSGVTYNDIYVEDRYKNKEIAIILPGDYSYYYNSIGLDSNNSVIKTISVTTNNNLQTEIIIKTTKIQGYKLVDKNKYVGILLGNPRDMYKFIVVLDAGHGGTDPGAIYKHNGKTINERDLNLSVINKTEKYFNSDNSEIKVYYTRTDNTFVNLYDRAAISKQVGADLFISVHMNANTKNTIKGTEVYYYAKNTSKTASGLNSEKLAKQFLNYLPGVLGTAKRNIFSNNLVVLRENTVPAVLIEFGFMSTPSELALLVQDSFQEKAAKALYDNLQNIFEQYPTGR